MNVAKLRYLSSGISGRLTQPRLCPACKHSDHTTVDKKYFHSLLECRNCGLRYRYPSETNEKAKEFYQHEYSEEGLTTDLPSDEYLAKLLKTGFRKSEKDFSHVISIMSALGISPGMRVLDFGANWGYATYQFREHGFDAVAFEVSAPRAAFGERIGVTVQTELINIGGEFAAVYSSHVLEHIPNPMEALQQQLDLVKPGGVVLGHTPNGSYHRQNDSPTSYRANWGMVHPVLLTEKFISTVADGRPYFVTSNDNLEKIESWNGKQIISEMDGANMFFAIRA